MNGMHLHYRNLGWVSAGTGWMNMTHNLLRLVQFKLFGANDVLVLNMIVH